MTYWRVSMSLDDLGLTDYEAEEEKTLLIDGDILIYKPCCIYNEDDDYDRKQIEKNINHKIDQLMELSGCGSYIMFVTTKTNFRDFLVDDYKANRIDTVRPVNLAWAKRWAVDTFNTHYRSGLEADDLLGIHQTKDTVIWSLDKDLRQISGLHLDDATSKVITVTENGVLRKKLGALKNPDTNSKARKATKYYFDGLVGLYFQMLTGDDTDWIVGCGERKEYTVKSGASAGQVRLKRFGIGPGKAYEMLSEARTIEDAFDVVCEEYRKQYGDNWIKHLEIQSNLLFMVREHNENLVRQWTYDDREQWLDIDTGETHEVT